MVGPGHPRLVLLVHGGRICSLTTKAHFHVVPPRLESCWVEPDRVWVSEDHFDRFVLLRFVLQLYAETLYIMVQHPCRWFHRLAPSKRMDRSLEICFCRNPSIRPIHKKGCRKTVVVQFHSEDIIQHLWRIILSCRPQPTHKLWPICRPPKIKETISLPIRSDPNHHFKHFSPDHTTFRNQG